MLFRLILSTSFLLYASLVQADRSLQERIYNGDDVPADSYPWFARPLDGDGDWDGCGASLISADYVLTAAHCFFDSNGSFSNSLASYEIGALCPDSNNNCGQNMETIDVESLTLHPNYDDNTFDNDFAIAKLSSSSTVTPVNIDNGSYSPNYSSGKELWGIGFGEQEDGADATVLQHVALKYDPDCADNHIDGDITENMMCATDGIRDTCQGDSGGPLYDVANDVLVGVTSWGNGCGNITAPAGVYARISAELDWIKGIVCTGSNQPSWCSESSCEDSPLRMKVYIPSLDAYKMKSCTWAANNPGYRCTLEGVSSHCPVACSSACGDSTMRFKLIKPDGTKKNRNCNFVSRLNTAERCSWTGVADTCRSTCA